MAADSFDAVVTDPPYELAFMGRHWDASGISFDPDTWRAVLRVMKPGAFMVCFASTRGYHRMVCAIEDAGFLVHPMLGWITGQGFPKATRFDQPELGGWRYGLQALKPALEPICMAQRPMAKGLTGSQNWARHGCGGINVDACRVAGAAKPYGNPTEADGYRLHKRDDDWTPSTTGRWPPNVCHDGSPEVLAAFAAYGDTGAHGGGARGGKRGMSFGMEGQAIEPGQRSAGSAARFFYNAKADRAGSNGALTRHAGGGTIYGKCDGGQPKVQHNDTGSASRFFYSAKASKADRANSKHPTVKPLSLMRWLCRLITPPGGHILDPFAGSGTTGEAAMLEGFNATLIEREAEYVADIQRRLARRHGADAPLFAVAAE